MKKTVFLFATAVLATFTACNNFKTTAVLSDGLDSLNYAFGVANGASFKRAFGEDTTKAAYNAFLSGFNKGFDSVPEKKLEEANAILAGIRFKETVSQALKDGFLFQDSTFTADKKTIDKTAKDVLAGKDSIYGFTAQSAQQYYFKIYRQQRDSVKQPLTAEILDSLNVAFVVSTGGRAFARIDSAQKVDFVKNYKKGYATKPMQKHYYNGYLYANQGYNMLKGGIGDSTITLKPELVVTGINAGLLGDTTVFTGEAAMLYFQTAITERLFGKNRRAGEEFLAENEKREGVYVTESGLQYEVVREGKGAKPTEQDTVKVHYEGMLLDSTVFDSSYERSAPTEFPVNRVISGWTEGLQLMQVGSEYKFYIPYFLAYGEQGSRNQMGEFTIRPYEMLIFKVELLGVKKFIPQATIQNQSLK